MSGVNTGAYFCEGTSVTVVDELGDWTGRILSMGTTSGAPVRVGVIEPAANTQRRQGERVEVAWSQLRQPPRAVRQR